MLKTLLSLLDSPAPEPLADDDARVAVTALMIRLAREDGHYDTREKQMIEQIASARYDADIPKLMAEADAFEAAAGDTVRITHLVKEGVPYEERIRVVEDLWQVVLADDTRTDEENAFLRLVVSLIGVTDQESGLARRRVAKAADVTKPIR